MGFGNRDSEKGFGIRKSNSGIGIRELELTGKSRVPSSGFQISGFGVQGFGLSSSADRKVLCGRGSVLVEPHPPKLPLILQQVMSQQATSQPTTARNCLPSVDPASLLSPTPETLNPQPYTLHPTLYTLHSTPFTLDPKHSPSLNSTV